MLSEQVLEELVRDTPLQQTIVQTAWPSLNTESRLQVINTIQVSNLFNTPMWLMELCIDDPTPIVRYWASRQYSFPASKELQESSASSASNAWPFNTVRSDDEMLIRTKAADDASKLVRACTSEDFWKKGATFDLLVLARICKSAGLIQGLNRAFDNGMSNENLAVVLRELLKNPEVQADLKFDGDYRDGGSAYLEGQLLKDGWALVRKAGSESQKLLANVLPTYRGFGQITPAELATLPDPALISLAFRSEKTKEISEALDLVLNSSEKYDAETIDWIRNGLEVCRDFNCEVAKGNASVGHDKDIYSEVLALKKQIEELVEQLTDLRLITGAKKSWFS